MQRAVMLRVGVTIKQIENKHFQTDKFFEFESFGEALPPIAPPPWLRC